MFYLFKKQTFVDKMDITFIHILHLNKTSMMQYS